MNLVRHSTPRRIAAGLVLGAALGVALLATLHDEARRVEHQRSFERTALVSLRALAEVVGRAEPGEPTRAAAGRFAAGEPALRSVRLVDAGQRSLEFSSFPEDAAAGPPPRRLEREEKPFYDLAQQLRAALERNREEGARDDEIVVQPAAGGRLGLAAPVERQGEFAGIVQAETEPLPPAPRSTWLAMTADLAKVVLPLLILLLAAGRSERLRRHPGLLAAAGALLLALGLWLADSRAGRRMEAERRAAEGSIGQHLQAVAGRALGALAAPAAAPAAPPPPLDPASWDGDRFRRSRGVLRSDGSVDAARFEAELAATAGDRRRIVVGVILLALALSLAIGLGGAAQLAATLYRHRVAYSYAVPALLGMLVLAFFPFFYGIALSFTNANIYNTDQSIAETWVGLQNYQEILGDLGVRTASDEGTSFNYRNFYWTLGFTIVWTVSNVALGLTIGLVLALILNTKGLALKPAYRVLLILPWAVPNYITSLIWKGMFHQQFGVINQVVQIFGGEPVSWFERPATSFATVLATNGWLSFPFMMVMALGALQSIPGDLYEAARVDGASRWRQFTGITLPMLKPALVPAVIISVIWTFNMFNIIYLVSQGEPAGATEILITQAYKLAFEQYRYGYAAAYSTVIFVILLAYGLWQNRVTQASEGV